MILWSEIFPTRLFHGSVVESEANPMLEGFDLEDESTPVSTRRPRQREWPILLQKCFMACALVMTIALFTFLGQAVYHSGPSFREEDLVVERASGDVKVGMALLSYGEGSRHHYKAVSERRILSPVEGAMQLHQRYARKWGYPLWVGRGILVTGPHGDQQTAIYTKQALMHSIIINELRKPESQRLEWVFFLDADTVIMDDNVPLETFLPLNNTFGNDRLILYALDQWGSFNSGVFGARVSGVALKYLSAILADHVIHPERKYGNGEQTNMVLAAKLAAFEDRVSVVPAHWFNADSSHLLDQEHHPNTREIFRYGDLLIHFMAEHKVGFEATVLAALRGHNSTVAPLLENTRYMQGGDTVQAWWMREAAKPREQRVKDMQNVPAW